MRFSGATPLDDEILQTLGRTKLAAGGIGSERQFDSRDNEYSPHHGWLMKINNIAYQDLIAVRRITTRTGRISATTGGTATRTCWPSSEQSVDS